MAWTNVSQLWAEVMPFGGRERIEAQQVTPELSHKIRVRYRDDVMAERRLLLPQNSDVLGAAIINGVVTSITASDTDLIKSDRPTIIRCEDEFMIVTAGFGTTALTVTRGAFGSTAAAHTIGKTVIRMAIVEIDNVIDTGNAHVELIANCKMREM
jgi:head-tail adaptor